MKVFAGFDDLTDGLALYMRSHPFAAHVLDNNDLHVADERIARDGIALVCPARTRYLPSATWCVNNATSIAERFPPGKRMKLEVSRHYFGVEGKPARYLIITVPPQQ